MRFGVLGSLMVMDETGREIVLPAGRLRILMAALLLRANHVVSLDELVDALWDGQGPAGAARTARVHVTRLRQALGPTADRVVTRAPGYLVRVEDGELDEQVFRTLCREAGAAARERRWTPALESLTQALGLWRGTPLADVPSESLRGQFVPRAEQSRLQALEDRIEAELRLGRCEQVVPRVRDLAVAYPLRERFHAQLIAALAAGGRRAEALDAYQQARRVLVDELGIEPGPELRTLHKRILDGEADPIPPQSIAPREPVPARTAPRQLPAAVCHFTGREAELDKLTRVSDEMDVSGGTVVISAIEGTAGIGKTALAVHWAHEHADRFPDGQLYVNLRGFDPGGQPLAPAEALLVLFEALGIPATSIPASIEAQIGLYRSELADRRLLVVLDNARDADHVRPLLPGAPTSLVLVTSRNQLAGLVAVEGAHPVTLDVLSAEEAHDLLVRRLDGQRIAAEPRAVEELVELCARLPLALNIAAARATLQPGYPLEALVEELRDARDRLGALDMADTTASVRAVLWWSYRVLEPATARMFRLLAAHPGPDISVPAAASLADTTRDQARGALHELARAHLLNEHVPGRHVFHDLLRAYAAEQARAHDAESEQRDALRRVCDFYTHTAYSADRLLDPHREPIGPNPPAPGIHSHHFADDQAALAWFEAEHLNLLATQTAGADQHWNPTVWQLAWALTTFHYRRGRRHNELVVWRTALEAADRLPDPATRAFAHRRLGVTYAALGRHEEAIRHLDQTLALAEGHHDSLGQAHAHRTLAWASDRQGENRQALHHATCALNLYRSLDQKLAEARALNDVAWYGACLGDYDTARTHCEAALTMYQHHRSPEGEADTLDTLGYIEHHTGHSREAIDHYQQALTLYRSIGNTSYSANTLDTLGHPYLALGQRELARTAWQQALDLYRQQERVQDAERVQKQLATLDHPDSR